MKRKIRIFLLCIILFGAGWTDLTSGKVRNLWLLAGVIPGICLGGTDFLRSAGLILLPSYLLFRTGMMGAGDGKLMALIVGYLGMDSGLRAIGLGLLMGLVWTCAAFGKMRVKKQKRIIPLAVYLTAGTYVYLLISCAVQLKDEMGGLL